MFQELEHHINVQNIDRIRQSQREIEREESRESSQDSQEGENSQLEQRLLMFRMLMEERQVSGRASRYPSQLSMSQGIKLAKEKALLEQKMIIERKSHEQELVYMQQKCQRELQTLQSQIEKYQFMHKKTVKEEGIISSLRKENRHLHELVSQKEQLAQQAFSDNTGLKKELLRMKNVLREQQEYRATLEADRHRESDSERRLKEEVARLKQQKATQSQRRKQLEQSGHKVRLQNDQLTRDLDKLKMEFEHERQSATDSMKGDMSKLEDENKELKRRNQKLQQSFIEHLTQTSLNLQQTLKCPQRPRNSSLYLNETPIKARSRVRERVSSVVEQQDPEKGDKSKVRCDCSGQVNKLKGKLKHANAKIVGLLQQKCTSYRQK